MSLDIAAREYLSNAPGLCLVDDPSRAEYPMPLRCANTDDCQVGRLRLDCARWRTGWPILGFGGSIKLKGAALNAVQIAEMI